MLVGVVLVLGYLYLRFGPNWLILRSTTAMAKGWSLVPASLRALFVDLARTATAFPDNLGVVVPIGALAVALVFAFFATVGAGQLPVHDVNAARLRPIRAADLSGGQVVYEPLPHLSGEDPAGGPSPMASPSEAAPKSPRPAPPASAPDEPPLPRAPPASPAPSPWTPPSVDPLSRSAASGRTRARWTAAPSGGAPASAGARGGAAEAMPPETMTVWSAFGKSTLPNDLPPPRPGSRPPPQSNFGTRMLLTFASVTTLLILFRGYWLAQYDRLVQLTARALYFPTATPSPYSFPIGSFALADYVLLMYLSLMIGWGLASGLFWSGRFSHRQRWIGFEILAFYLGTEALIDSVAFTASNAFTASGYLVLRGLTGGFFSLLLLFDSFVLPRPVLVEPKFPRRRGSVALFLGVGVLSLLIAGGVLYLLWGALSSRGVTIPFAVLLLEPLLTIIIFDLLGTIAYHRELETRRVPSVEEYHPPVSIIVPAYNEERGIAETIRAADLAARLYPGPTEIVIGNDGSTDRTSEVARAEMARLRHATMLVVDLPHGGKSNALNGALRVAQGEILIRVDADTRLSEEYGFSAIIPHFADPEVGAIQGLILPLQRNGWTRKLRLLEICWNHLFLRRGLMGTRATQVVDGAFCAFRRRDILDAGGWVHWNGEDNEITLRLYRLGFRTRYEPKAVAFEDVPENYQALRKQRIRWNRGGVYAHRRHFGALGSGAFEFGGIAVMVWGLMFMKSGMRYFVYVYALLITLLAGVATIYTVAFILLVLLILRGSVIAYYIARLGWWRDLVWIPLWPVASAIKQSFSVEAFGTMVPGRGHAEFSE